MNWIILGILLYLAYTDIKSREIPNWITFGLIISGIIIHLIWLPVSWGLIVWASVLSIVLYFIGFWSEADVKLTIGLSFWLTTRCLVHMCFFYLLIVFLMGIIWMIRNRSFAVRVSYPAGPVFLSAFCLTFVFFGLL